MLSAKPAYALIVFFAFGLAPAVADDRAVCEFIGSNPRLALPACDRVLAAGGFDDREKASLLVSRGLHYMGNDRAKAIADLDAAIALKPDLARAWWGRAFFNEHTHDLRKDPALLASVIADYDKAIALKPDDVERYYERGLLFSSYDKDDTRAVADFSKIIELNPRYAAAYLARANAYKKRGDFQRQIADLSAFVNVTHGATGYIDRGMAYLHVKDYDNARADFNEALKRDPYHPSPLSGLADIYTAKGDYAQALALYDRAIKRAPHLTWVYSGRARTFLKMDEYDKALADASRSLAIFRNVAAFNARAEIYEAMGRKADAAADYRAALALHPTPEASAASRAGLQRLGEHP